MNLTWDIPLEVQLELLNRNYDAACEYCISVYTDERDELKKLSIARIEEGFPTYRHEMFLWDKLTRKENAWEELADAPNYLIPGPIG